MDINKKELSASQREELIAVLNERFKNNMNRHQHIDWNQVETRLKAKPEKMWTLNEMEITGGEPDVIGQDEQTKEFIFCDCAAESPKGRRSLCYDTRALEARKEHKPKNSAMNLAAEMGIEILDEAQYRSLQQLGKFDSKTSSWIKTPTEIRTLGGALFCDYRYETVFVYHNGAESYYGARAFRGLLSV